MFTRSLMFIITACCLTLAVSGQSKPKDLSKPDPSKKTETVEVSCGKCQFHLAGRRCALAVRINGKAYYADGVDINTLGDAHTDDGLCNAIRKADVQGRVVKERFRLSYFRLLPAANR